MAGNRLPDSQIRMIEDICRELGRYTHQQVSDELIEKCHARKLKRFPTSHQIKYFLPTARFNNVIKNSSPHTYEYISGPSNRYTLREHTIDSNEEIHVRPGSFISTIERRDIGSFHVLVLEKGDSNDRGRRGRRK